MNLSAELKAQYERSPYPPLPSFLIPHRDTGLPLRFARGLEMAPEKLQNSLIKKPERILVVGCGTIEPVVVALQHPEAKEIVAIDVSKNSLRILQRRLFFTQIARSGQYLLGKKPLPKITLIQSDLREFSEKNFDYILASCVLHHLENPGEALQHLASLLQVGGLFRLVVYPRQSRIFMRLTANYFREQGLHAQTPNLKKSCQKLVGSLSPNHPVRSCFISNTETTKQASLIDAFFNVCENPPSPLEWYNSAKQGGLTWLGEDHNPSSQSIFLNELCEETTKLSPWICLEIMDMLLEVCDNPILWFAKTSCKKEKSESKDDSLKNIPELLKTSSIEELKSKIHTGLVHAHYFLNKVGVPLEKMMAKLRQDVGPRIARDGVTELPGLSITEYFDQN